MQVNIIAVIVIGVVSMLLGFVWYGPLFANAWMEGVGLTKDDVKTGPGVGYLITFIAAMLMAATTSQLVHMLNVSNWVDGLALGALLGVGYVATTFATNYIFAMKSLKLYMIDAGYQVLLITLAGMIATLIR